MEVVAAASSVTAIVDISAKVASLCYQYSNSVLKARSDILRLYNQVDVLQSTLRHAKKLLAGPGSLHITNELSEHLGTCETELEKLRAKLEPDEDRPMRRVGLRSLKWPFSSSETENQIAALQRCQQGIILSLQIDQTSILLGIDQGIQNLSLQTNQEVPTSQKAHFVLPFPRDTDFVPRLDLQLWLKEQYASPSTRIAIVGLGGFGKSQVAIEFAYETRDINPGTSIFWVHGGTKARFEESYQSLANALDLPYRHDPGTNILALVRDWLQRTDIAPWLMIMDNVDDVSTFFDGSVTPLASYVPKTSHGKLVITSRNMTAAERLTGSQDAIWQISAMDSAQALQLFRIKLKAEPHGDSDADLVETLDFVPLAVTQAAAYINRRSPRVSTASYLESFQQNEKQRGNLLNFDAGDLRRHESLSNSVALTWQVTFDQIRRERQTAASLLSLMSFFHAQNIPEYMLSGYTEDDMAEGQYEDRDEDDYEDDIEVLRAYSLISMSNGGFCNMHPLVQFCTQRWLSSHEDLGKWTSLFIRLAAFNAPSGKFETWPKCQNLLPHIQPILDEQPMDQTDALAWAEVQRMMSVYMQSSGDYFRAETAIRKCLNVTRTTIPDDMITLKDESFLALTLQDLGQLGEAETLIRDVIDKYQTRGAHSCRGLLESKRVLADVLFNYHHFEEVEKLQRETVEESKKLFGPDDSLTLENLRDLATTLQHLNRLDEAEQLMHEVIEAQQRLLRGDSLLAVDSMIRLADIYWDQDRIDKAESIEINALEVRKRLLGFDHPDTLLVMYNLALTLSKKGKRTEAIDLMERCLLLQRAKLGADHPKTLDSMDYLSASLSDQGRLEEGEKLGVAVLESRKRVLGMEHPGTLSTMCSLARTLFDNHKTSEGLGLMEECVSLRRTFLGDEHGDTLSGMAILAMLLFRLNRVEEAEELEATVFQCRKRKLGANHGDTLLAMRNLAISMYERGKTAEAVDLLQDCVQRQRLEIGADHRDTLQSVYELATQLFGLGRMEETEELRVEVLEGRKRSLGMNHPDTIQSMADLSTYFWEVHRIDEAEELDFEVLEMRKKVLGPFHRDTLLAMYHLAAVWYENDRDTEAIDLMQECVRLQKIEHGEDHGVTLDSMRRLSVWLLHMDRFEEVEGLRTFILAARTKSLGQEDTDTIKSMEALAELFWYTDRLAEAEKLDVEVLKRVLGADDPDTLRAMQKLAAAREHRGKVTEALELKHECMVLRERVLSAEHPAQDSAFLILKRWVEDMATISEATPRCAFPLIG